MRNEPVTTTFHFIQHLLLVIGKVFSKKECNEFQLKKTKVKYYPFD